MMGVLKVGAGNHLEKLFFDFVGRFPFGESRAVGDAEDVGVDGERRMTEGDVEHHVRGFASDARKGHQGVAVFGDLAAVYRKEPFAETEDVLDLAAV